MRYTYSYKRKFNIFFILFTLLIGSIFADENKLYINDSQANNMPVIVVGEISAAELESQNKAMWKKSYRPTDNSSNNTQKKLPPYIKFMRLAPNPNYKPNLLNQAEKLTSANYPASRMLSLPTEALDQGTFGTCATFSVLGALDTASGNASFGNQPSPSCSLQLATTVSGSNVWNGAVPYNIYSILNQYGTISNDLGSTGFCNANYPTYMPYGSSSQDGQGLTVSLSTYSQQSYKPQTFWRAHMVTDGLDYIKQQLNDTSINNVKGLPGAYTVFLFYATTTFDTLYVDGTDGASPGQYLVFADHADPINPNAGHAIFAYGYDDNLCININGDMQCGMLFLRNSWGADSSHNGDYLMTYKFFYRHYMTGQILLSFPNINYQ